MKRRALLGGMCSVAATAIILPSMAAAEQSCDQTQFGELCSSYIPIERLRRVYAAQQQPEWCWAASISMIFGFSGHPVAQARIVQDAYGAVVNMPGNYPALLGSLDREWIDDDGNQFTVAIDSIFAPELGGVALSNDD